MPPLPCHERCDKHTGERDHMRVNVNKWYGSGVAYANWWYNSAPNSCQKRWQQAQDSMVKRKELEKLSNLISMEW